MAKEEERRHKRHRRFISQFSELERQRKRPWSGWEMGVGLIVLGAALLAVYDMLH